MYIKWGGAIFPRVYYSRSGMPNSLKSGGGAKFPVGMPKSLGNFYSGMPNPLGYHIPCDTGKNERSDRRAAG